MSSDDVPVPQNQPPTTPKTCNKILIYASAISVLLLALSLPLLLSPRVPTPPPCILWMAPFLSGGGYSSEAWSYITSLHAAATTHPLTLKIDHHGDLFSPAFWAGLPNPSKLLASSLLDTHCPIQQSIVVCHSEPGAWYPPLYQTVPCPPTGYKQPRFVIGRTMFETDRVSPEHVRRCNRMDQVWVPTDFHVSTFLSSGVDPSKIVKMVQPVDVDFFDPSNHIASLPFTGRPVLGSGGGTPRFLFLSVFKWEYRKGWDVLLRSYLREFSGGDGVALYLLTSAYHSASDFADEIIGFVGECQIEEPEDGWAAVYVIDVHVPQIALPGMYKAVDAFVLPSRGEGWGRPIVEAMAMALPVIATNWSGMTEYLTEENGYPLPVERMSEVAEGPFKGHMWAEPSGDQLRILMRHVVNNREEGRRKGSRAREDMIDRFSPKVVARLVVEQFMKILKNQTDRGEV